MAMAIAIKKICWQRRDDFPQIDSEERATYRRSRYCDDAKGDGAPMTFPIFVQHINAPYPMAI